MDDAETMRKKTGKLLLVLVVVLGPLRPHKSTTMDDDEDDVRTSVRTSGPPSQAELRPSKHQLRKIVANVGMALKVPETPSFGSMPNRHWDLRDWFGDPKLAHERLGWVHRYNFRARPFLTAEWERLAEPRNLFAVTPKTPESSVARVIEKKQG